jgi:hypothetical protein
MGPNRETERDLRQLNYQFVAGHDLAEAAWSAVFEWTAAVARRKPFRFLLVIAGIVALGPCAAESLSTPTPRYGGTEFGFSAL